MVQLNTQDELLLNRFYRKRNKNSFWFQNGFYVLNFNTWFSTKYSQPSSYFQAKNSAKRAFDSFEVQSKSKYHIKAKSCLTIKSV